MPTSRYFWSGVTQIPAGAEPASMVQSTVSVLRSIAAIWSLSCRVMKAILLSAVNAIWLGVLGSGNCLAILSWRPSQR